jgi:ubiquinone/menaquinone biosynthesis C-methylase UbiE
MQRVLEPELMDDEEQVIAYAEADFEEPNHEFVQRVKALVAEPTFSGDALDLGCGPGDISQRFVNAFPFCQCDAIDGSKPMIDFARETLSAELQSRLNFIHGKLPDSKLPKTSYDIIFSNSLLHHLPEPDILWLTVKRNSKPGTRIAVMDLIRPESIKMAKKTVERYAYNEPEILQHDFYCSLLAAFTMEEINLQLQLAELHLTLEQISDRHVFISGILN